MQELESTTKRKDNESPNQEESLVKFSKKLAFMDGLVWRNTMIKTFKLETCCDFVQSVIQW